MILYTLEIGYLEREHKMNKPILRIHKVCIPLVILMKLFTHTLLSFIIVLSITPTISFGDSTAPERRCRLYDKTISFYGNSSSVIKVPETELEGLYLVRIDKMTGQNNYEIHYIIKPKQFVASQAYLYGDMFLHGEANRVYLFCYEDKTCIKKDVVKYSLCLTKDKIKSPFLKLEELPDCIDEIEVIDPEYVTDNCTEHNENPSVCELSERSLQSFYEEVDFCHSEIDESETNNGCGIIKNRPAFPLLLIMLLIGLFALIYPRKTKPKKI